MRTKFMLFCLLAVLAVGAHADTLLSVTGGTNAGGWVITQNQPLASGWTIDEGQAFSNVSISAWLKATNPTTGYAYLNTELGENAALHQVAFKTFSFPEVAGDAVKFTIFDDLTLGPGTYFLTLAVPSGMGTWALDNLRSVTYGAGVSDWTEWYANTYAEYAPSVNFYDATGDNRLFEVTGDIGGAVPEPAAMSLLGLGLAMFGVVRRLRK